MNFASLIRRYWNSPGAMTALSVLARALSMAAPLPFLYAYFESTIVAYWLLVITFQSVVGGISGILPTISMQMLSYAEAGSKYLAGTMADHQNMREQGPNTDLKSFINDTLTKIFSGLAIAWLLLSATAGTAIIWSNLVKLPSFFEGAMIWIIFISMSAVRLRFQPFTAYLFAVGETALARRLESFAWLLGTTLTLLTMLIYPNVLLAMACLYAPVGLQYYLAKKYAIAQGWQRKTPTASDLGGQNIFKLIWQRAWRGSLGVMAGMLTIYGGGFIFAQYAGSAELAGFLLAINLLGILQQVAISPLFGSMPAMAASFAKGDKSRLFALADHVIGRSSWVFATVVIPVPLGVLCAQLLGFEIVFVSPAIWLALSVSLFIVRFGAAHLYFYTVTNEVKMHIANGIFAVFYLCPMMVIPEPRLELYPLIQGAAAIVYAAYARSITWRKLQYTFRRDIFVILPPLAIMFVGIGMQIIYLQ